MSAEEELAGDAIEYVIGTLDQNERQNVSDRRNKDHTLDNAILDWEARLAPLNALAPDVMPSPGLWPRIKSRLPSSGSVALVDLDKLRGQLKLWQRVAAASLLLAAIGWGNFYLEREERLRQPAPIAPTLVASLQQQAAPPAFLIGLDEKAQQLKILALGNAAPTDKDYELWLIADGLDAPRSLGVVRPETVSLKADLHGLAAEAVRKATLAISLEPSGGSPTGKPTGPVLFTGTFVAAKL